MAVGLGVEWGKAGPQRLARSGRHSCRQSGGGGLPKKGTFPQALKGSEAESRGQVEGHEVTWSDLPFGSDMEDVLGGEVGSTETGDEAVGIQVSHH